MDATMVRKPAVAGTFYPQEPERLRETVCQYMEESQVEPSPERVAAIVAPHAGYIYSGPTAGYAYARIRGKTPKRVIILGCSHRYHIDKASVYDRGGFETPLGTFPIDEEFAGALAEETGSTSLEPHLLEHGLEVQLPFLSAALGEVPIVPVLLGMPSTKWHAQLGETLSSMVDESDLVITSTDLSHYLSEEQANAIDKDTLDKILDQDWNILAQGMAEGACSMCGATAVTTAMTFSLARDARSWTVLDYRTSARVSGDYERVVGYAAVCMERDG